MASENFPSDENPSEGKPRVTDGGERLGEIFEAMTDQRRRYVLYFLQEEEVADIETLAEHVAAWEQDITVEAVSEDEVTNVQIDLFHTHLPKLQDAGLVEYDRRSRTARYRLPSALINKLLQLAARIERPQTQ